MTFIGLSCCSLVGVAQETTETTHFYDESSSSIDENVVSKESTEESFNENIVTETSSEIEEQSTDSEISTPNMTEKTLESSVGTSTIIAPSVEYQTHVQTFGWLGYVKDGGRSGTEGQAKRLEAIQIKINSGSYEGSIEYQTHIQKVGWESGYKTSNQISGTSGQALRLEAIKIRLTGELSEVYDIYYRVHVQKFGWLDWAKNGESSGTEGFAYRLEAIEIKLVEKGAAAPGKTNKKFVKFKQPNISYQAHVQKIGWQSVKINGETAGTSGLSYRIEGIKASISNLPDGMTGGIQYKTHVQTFGWQGWVADNALSGTVGQAKRLEAIQLILTGEAAQHYDLYYRVHVQSFGWLGWATNGGNAGTSDGKKRMEAIQIMIVKKTSSGPALGKAFLSGNEALTAAEKAAASEAAAIASRKAKAPYYYSQLDGRWSGMSFGTSTLGPSGCVPTSMAMVLRGCYGINVTPVDTAKRIYGYGGFNQKYFGASGTDLVKGINSYGRSITNIQSLSELNNYLSKGYPVIMYVNVGIGHAIVAHGYSNGTTNIYDPYGRQFYSGWVSTSHLWNNPSNDSIDWSAGRPYFVVK